MKTVADHRHDWLVYLIDKHGSLADLNVLIGRRRRDPTLCAVKKKAPMKSGRSRSMGSNMAREIESHLSLEPGTLDSPLPEELLAQISMPKQCEESSLCSFGERLRAARIARDISQSKLSFLTGVTLSTIGHAETCRTNGSRKINAFAKALQVNPVWLRTGEGESYLDRPMLDAESVSVSIPWEADASGIAWLDRFQNTLDTLSPPVRDAVVNLTVSYVNTRDPELKQSVAEALRRLTLLPRGKPIHAPSVAQQEAVEA
jgi:transcriptional regulator with XRE-family HTH domain